MDAERSVLVNFKFSEVQRRRIGVGWGARPRCAAPTVCSRQIKAFYALL